MVPDSFSRAATSAASQEPHRLSLILWSAGSACSRWKLCASLRLRGGQQAGKPRLGLLVEGLRPEGLIVPLLMP